ncbi:retrotransposon protein, putative, ty1-copia subclass [Tanacetum coccineum]
MSPYLFTLVMEVLTLMLHRRARVCGSFTYHRYCSKLNSINLCFVDEHFLFPHGDVDSARIIMDTLEEFKEALGLTPSLPKSTAYFCNVLNYIKLDILNILPLEEGKLPVKYLGVHLVPSRLLCRDCKELMEKVKRRISDWKNKSLSFARRVQLIRSVLASMHIYWASVFILPTGLMLELDQLMRGFLWYQGEMKKGRAKVAWEVVSQWALFLGDSYSGFLALTIGVCWALLRILFLTVTFGGYNRSDKVKDIIVNDSWSWSDVWMSKYSDLGTIGVPHLFDASDKLVWKDLSNVDVGFLVATVWECIRLISDEMDWYHVVWDHLKRLTGIPNIPSGLDAIVDFLSPMAKMRSARSVISKLVFAASWAGLKEECSPIAVLFFPSPRFFPLGFSWEGFLRRQGRLAVYTPMLLQRNVSVALCCLGLVSSDLCGCSSKLLELAATEDIVRSWLLLMDMAQILVELVGDYSDSGGLGSSMWFTLRYENKEYVLDDQIPTIDNDSTQEEFEAHRKHYDHANKVSCIMASSMSRELQKTFENTYEMNQQLKEMFQPKASKERLDVVKSLMDCKPKPEASNCAFVLEMKGYFDILESLNMVFDTELSINIILSGLPADYNQFVLSYQMNTKDTSIMELHSLLQTTKQGIKKSNVPSTSAALELDLMAAKGKFNRGSKRNAESEIAPTNDPKEAACFYCNTKGHWKRSCLKYLRDLKDEKVLKENRRLKHGELNIVMGNRKVTPVTRIGKYEFMLKSGVRIDLNNCCYSSEMTRNIISFHALFKDGYKFSFDNENGDILLDESKLWHSRLGDINKKCIAQLQKDGVLESFDFKSDDACVSCILSEMTKSPFTRSCERGEGLLDLVHTYVCGPFRSATKDGKRYYVTFTDDFSRYGYVYLIKHKSDTFEVFKRYSDPKFYYGFQIEEDKISDSTLSELDEPANHKEVMASLEASKPDVSFAVSRHPQNPGEGHWTAVKNILKYLRNTKDRFLVYGGEEELKVTGYCDGAVTWKGSKQDTMVDSTCESEYIVSCEASKESIWIKNFIGDLGVVPTVQDPIGIFCDNKSAVALTKEPKDHGKSKHIEENTILFEAK